MIAVNYFLGHFFVLIVNSIYSIETVLSSPEVFTNSFYVQVDGSLSKNDVHDLAKRSGFVNLGPVSYESLCLFSKPIAFFDFITNSWLIPYRYASSRLNMFPCSAHELDILFASSRFWDHRTSFILSTTDYPMRDRNVVWPLRGYLNPIHRLLQYWNDLINRKLFWPLSRFHRLRGPFSKRDSKGQNGVTQD